MLESRVDRGVILLFLLKWYVKTFLDSWRSQGTFLEKAFGVTV